MRRSPSAPLTKAGGAGSFLAPPFSGATVYKPCPILERVRHQPTAQALTFGVNDLCCVMGDTYE